ncbi:uncharacterized protein LOC108681503 [Hyalella azteca]|uniref:Uncharacterized protein LOC108681503 n=1 Tax=Hyalella azteca TaxID=294128 RepID=A0A8B7PIN7_HYAAZ|nr:uncharacterized protein LOC108681503 [Hyalella azteca]
MKTSLLCLLLLVAAAASAAVGEADDSQLEVRSDKDDGSPTVLPETPQVGQDDGKKNTMTFCNYGMVCITPYYQVSEWLGTYRGYHPAGKICFPTKLISCYCCLDFTLKKITLNGVTLLLQVRT